MTPAEQLQIVSTRLEFLSRLRLLHPLDPESEWAYVTLRDREHDPLGALSRKDLSQRAQRGEHAFS